VAAEVGRKRAAVPLRRDSPSGMMIVIMNFYEEARAWANHTAYLRLPQQLIRLPMRQHSYPEVEFKSMCKTTIANHFDAVDTRIVQLSERIKRSLYVYHSSIIRNSIACTERPCMFIDASVALTEARTIYLTPQ
jgi:hypothetical protein